MFATKYFRAVCTKTRNSSQTEFIYLLQLKLSVLFSKKPNFSKRKGYSSPNPVAWLGVILCLVTPT